MMKRIGKLMVCAALATLLIPSVTYAQKRIRPDWVTRNEASLNRSRTNDTYEIKVFHTYDGDLTTLEKDALVPVLTYVRETYGADALSMVSEKVISGTEGQDRWRITFDAAGRKGEVYAQRIDTYNSFDSYGNENYQFEYDQLWAVSRMNVQPKFDEFSVRTPSAGSAFAMSLIPGVGQIYKGQKTKGFSIMGLEVASVACAVYGAVRQADYHRMIADNKANYQDSWNQKENAWRKTRNFGIGMAAGIYVYQLVDAAVADGASRLKIKEGKTVEFQPVAYEQGAGMGLVFTF